MTEPSQLAASGIEVPAATDKRRPRRERVIVAVSRTAIVVAFLSAWQWLPTIPGIGEKIHFLDPFFISSPTRVIDRILDVTFARGNAQPIWPNLGFTLRGALTGTVIAVVIGTVAGLVLSNTPLYERILRPFVVLLNAIPRIAVVPVMILLTGTAIRASIATAVTVVVFLVFFNALEAGRGTPTEMIDSARVMGAPERDVMLRIRLPYVLGWVAASLPNAIAFGLVGSVTTEIFVGADGIGNLLMIAVNTADATLTFTVVVFLGVTGAALVLGANALRQKAMPWWQA